LSTSNRLVFCIFVAKIRGKAIFAISGIEQVVLITTLIISFSIFYHLFNQKEAPMKTKSHLLLSLSLMLCLACGNLSAQTSSNMGQTPATAPVATVNNTPANQDVLVMTGRIIDNDTKQPIKNARINFDKFGEELLHASIDDNGNYSIVLNKKELGEPIRVIFKISGYKRFVVKSVKKSITHLTADLFLEPEDVEGKSSGVVQYKLDDSPFNTTVIKMQ